MSERQTHCSHNTATPAYPTHLTETTHPDAPQRYTEDTPRNRLEEPPTAAAHDLGATTQTGATDNDRHTSQSCTAMSQGRWQETQVPRLRGKGRQGTETRTQTARRRTVIRDPAGTKIAGPDTKTRGQDAIQPTPPWRLPRGTQDNPVTAEHTHTNDRRTSEREGHRERMRLRWQPQPQDHWTRASMRGMWRTLQTTRCIPVQPGPDPRLLQGMRNNPMEVQPTDRPTRSANANRTDDQHNL